MADPCERERRDRMILVNQAFVAKVAREYLGRGMSLDDLIGEGNIGLVEAADRFDPTHGTKFLTYAVWWIRKRILEALATHPPMVRVPASRLRKLRRIREIQKQLTEELARTPDSEELSRATGETLAALDLARQLPHRAEARPRQGEAGEVDPLDHLPEPSSNLALNRVLEEEMSDNLIWALSKLAPRELYIVALRSGLGPHGPATLRELAGALGISRERVRQIEAQGTLRMRRLLLRRSRTYAV